jgi:hypothetical protein
MKEGFAMRSKWMVSLLVLAAVIMLVVPVFAQAFEKSVTFADNVKIGNVMLTAGHYKISVVGEDVTVRRGHDVVAQVKGRLEQKDQKFAQTAVTVDANGQVLQIEFGGENQVLIFTPQY